MKPYPFAALNHFTTPCSLLNFFTPRRDLRHLPGVTPVGGARSYPDNGPLHHYGITRPNQMRRNAGINPPSLSRALYALKPLIPLQHRLPERDSTANQSQAAKECGRREIRCSTPLCAHRNRSCYRFTYLADAEQTAAGPTSSP